MLQVECRLSGILETRNIRDFSESPHIHDKIFLGVESESKHEIHLCLMWSLYTEYEDNFIQ